MLVKQKTSQCIRDLVAKRHEKKLLEQRKTDLKTEGNIESGKEKDSGEKEEKEEKIL